MTLSEETSVLVNALSRKLDVDAAEITKGIEEIIKKDECKESKALTLWKTRNRGLFSSKQHDFIVFGKTEPREVPVTRKGEGKVDALVSNLDVIVETDNGLGVYIIGLWDDNADSVEGFDIGTKYSARMKLMTNGYANLVGTKVAKSKDSKLPDLDVALSKIQTKDIEEAADMQKQFGFFAGNVTRIVEGGVEVDSPTGLPVMCWCGGVADVPEFEIGDGVTVFGRVGESKRGDAVIYSHALYKKEVDDKA